MSSVSPASQVSSASSEAAGYSVEIAALCFPHERSWITIDKRVLDGEQLANIEQVISGYIHGVCSSRCKIMSRESYLLKHGLATNSLRRIRMVNPLSLYDPRRRYNARKVTKPICKTCALKAFDILVAIAVATRRALLRKRRRTARAC